MPADDRQASQIVLDTHTWIWLMEGSSREMSAATIGLIEAAAARSELAVSAISVWEVAMLEKRRRISLSLSINEWVNRALTVPGLRLADLTPEIALESTRLPGDVHGDPADRIIMATTRILGGTLVTRDKQILAYGRQGHIRTRNALRRGP